MDIHHIIRAAYSASICIYCSAELNPDKWESEFDAELHYKGVVCKCGKKNIIKLDFQGSGHDNWSRLEKKANGEGKKEKADIKK